jgi:hypothetical protein
VTTRAILAEAGTTLFHVAAKYLGDATEWSRIAAINDISDPFLMNLTPLEIPPPAARATYLSDG